MRLRGIESSQILDGLMGCGLPRKPVPSNVVAYATDKEDGHERWT